MPLDPGDNMKAAEDFLQIVLHAHIVAAAETIQAASENSSLSLTEMSEAIVKKFVQIGVPLPTSANAASVKDRVFLYATEVLTLGLIWENFHDANKEGDGDRLVRVWKLLLLIFKAARRKNYSIEALNLQLQINYTLSARQAAQLKWSRCVNTSNVAGRNIPMDLHLEHMNRRLKSTMRNMGSNMTESSVRLAAECIQVVDSICSKFEEGTSKCATTSQKHSSPSFQRDFELIVRCLNDQQVYNHTSHGTRQHASFKFANNLLLQYDYKKLISWMKRKIPDLV